jgi:hypothetical protein
MNIITSIAIASLTVGGFACSSSSSSPDAGGALGPGAKLKCDSSQKNAFDTYGATAFEEVNASIFANVTAEMTANGTTNLGTSFSAVGTAGHDPLNTFEGQLAAFLVFVYGGPSSITYTDNMMYTANPDMMTAHHGLAITAPQYSYFVTNIVVPALTLNGVKHGTGGDTSPDDVGSCFAPPLTDATFMASIVGQ